MTRTITAASATTGFAAVFRSLGRMLARPALPDQADDALSPRLAHDAGLTDLRPASDGSVPADPLARELMRRSY